MTTADQAVAELAHRLRSRVDFPMKLGSSLVIPGGCGGLPDLRRQPGQGQRHLAGLWGRGRRRNESSGSTAGVPALTSGPTPGMAVWIGLWLEIQKEMRMQYENCSCLLSGTGNTEAMAQAVAEGAKNAGGDVSLLTSADFGASDMDTYDAVGLRLSRHGQRGTGDGNSAPCSPTGEKKLSGKKIALFGSFGWGDGEWPYLGRTPAALDGAVPARASCATRPRTTKRLMPVGSWVQPCFP